MKCEIFTVRAFYLTQIAKIVFMTLMKSNFAILILILMTGTACTGAKGSDGRPRLQPKSLSYSFKDINKSGSFCTTGPQKFSNVNSYCNGLQDELLNSGCALDKRKALVKKYCL